MSVHQILFLIPDTVIVHDDDTSTFNLHEYQQEMETLKRRLQISQRCVKRLQGSNRVLRKKLKS